MNWKRLAAFTFAVLAVLLLGFQPAWAQATNATGSIEGVVTDPQGGILPGAKITVTRTDTGQVINLTSSSAGSFSTGPIVPGNYAVRVEAPSFKTYQTSVVAQVGQITTANAKLEVGSSSTVIEVTGTAVSVNTEQSQLSGDLTASQIENLPINGRNFLDLAQLEPGVQIQDGGNFDPTKIGFSSISFGGKFGRSARISVDGVDVSDENVGTTTTGIPAGAIQEFQLAQSSLDISNDLTSGGSVNVVTKSGSNALHGEAFGLFRDNSQAAGYPGGAQFQRSQYGGDVGGPILKDKLFFFVDAERLLAHDAGGVLVAPPLNSFSGTFPAPFHDTSTIGKLDYSISKNIKAFARFSFWQASDVGNFGGAANYSVYDNRDRTKTIAGGVDFNEGSFTHSFRAEYLKFVNVISDAVLGSNLPFASVPNEILLSGTGFESGPSFLAPQSTIQSDRQVKYDGSHVWGSHIIRWGVDYNRITGWTFASFFGITPQDVSSNLFVPTGFASFCPGTSPAGCPLNYTADTVAMGNGEGSFTELKRFGKPAGGLGPDDRVGAYIGDSWKVKPNFTLSYGLRYDRDTGRTDSDISLPAINNFIPGAGNAVHQPNHNFAPQAGFAWDPKSDGKTVIRGGVGIFYDNIVFNDVLFDRELKLASGQFNAVQNACNSGPVGGTGTGGVVGFGDGSAHLLGVAGAIVGMPSPGQQATANLICNTPIGATVGAGGGTCAGQVFANCTAAFQTALQASFAANPVGANGIFLPDQLAAGGVNLTGAGFLDPNYKSPRSIQMNIGVQRELRPGMVFSADYVRNVGLHYLLSTDVNRSGDVSNYDQALGAAAVTATLAACGVATVADAIVACPGLHATGGATMADFSANGLDSANDKGPFPCPNCAFAASNRNVGAFYEFHSGGRSVYNGMDLKLVQNVQHPFTGVKYLNFQGTYTFSRYVNAGSIASGANIAGGDADFVSTGLNNRNPLSLIGPGSLDRTHQFNFGGYADVPLGFRLGLISHFWSPFAATPTVLPVASATNAGTDGIFTSDFIGSGQVGNPLPIAETSTTCGTMGGDCTYNLYHVGAFMRSLGPGGLANAVSNYDSTIGSTLPTPAGQALINQGLFTLAQLQALGGVATHVAPVVPGQVGLGWLKAFDLEFSWVGHFFHERLTVQPSVNFYNLFNFSNFDSAANALTGQLNGTPGSINGTVQAGRPDRIGAGTGVFAFGAPRTIEWGLKLQF